MPLIPFRAKNTPERFPVVSIVLAAVFVVAYLFSANLQPGNLDYAAPFLSLQEPVAARFAASWDTIGAQPWRLLTFLFLHDDPLHLLGNLLMLAVFAPAVEGRLGAARFVALFVAAGAFSGWFQSLVGGVLAPEQLIVGASGAIMGLAGAYLYCFPFAAITVAVSFLWRFDFSQANPLAWFRPVCFDAAAKWVVLAFFLGDVWAAVWDDGFGGVANFAHVGGLLVGLVLVALLKVPRDSRRTSDARKLQSEGANLSALSEGELSALLVREPENPALLLAYAGRLCEAATPGFETRLSDLIRSHGAILSEQMDAATLAPAMLAAFGDAKMPPAPVLRVGSRLEKDGEPEALRLCAALYRALYKQEKNTPDGEMSLLKYAQVAERLVQANLSDNPNEPILMYQTFLRRFRASPHAFAAREGLARLGAPAPAEF